MESPLENDIEKSAHAWMNGLVKIVTKINKKIPRKIFTKFL
jgi:hypothetical protein